MRLKSIGVPTRHCSNAFRKHLYGGRASESTRGNCSTDRQNAEANTETGTGTEASASCRQRSAQILACAAGTLRTRVMLCAARTHACAMLCRCVSAGQRFCRHARVPEVNEAAGLGWLRVAPGIVEHAPIEDLVHAVAVDAARVQKDQPAGTRRIRKEYVVLALSSMVAQHDAGPQAIVTRPEKPHGEARTSIFLQLMLPAPPRLAGMTAARGGIESRGRGPGVDAPGLGQHAGRRRPATSPGLVRGDRPV